MNRAVADRVPASAPPRPEVAEPPPSRREAAASRAPLRPRLFVGLGVLGIMALSLVLKLEGQRVWYWIDEGLSVGISSHPVRAIPTLLREDGNPPLYYLLLHFWMRLFGTSEVHTHALSLVFAVATAGAAFWAGRSLFGRRAGWIAALLAATNPYITFYSRETRMYSLLILLGVVVSATFLHVFAYRRRQYLPAFVVSLALFLYTHNWAIFVTVGLVVAVALCLALGWDRKGVARDAAIGFGAAFLLYAPWLPTLLEQVRLTGAPWAHRPILRLSVSAVGLMLGDERITVVLFLAAGAGLAATMKKVRSGDSMAAFSIVTIFMVSLASAWAVSQVKPAWADRYFGALVASVLVLAALGLSRAGRLGLVGLVMILVFWTKPLARVAGIRTTPKLNEKSNAKLVASIFGSWLSPPDLVVSAQMEQVPSLNLYLARPGLRYATPMGPVADPAMADWRRATQRMGAATPEKNLMPLVKDLPVGHHVLLACPRVFTTSKDLAWFRYMDHRCRDWREALSADPSFQLLAGPAPPLETGQPGTSMFGMLYLKVAP